MDEEHENESEQDISHYLLDSEEHSCQSYEEVINSLGHGRYHWRLLFLIGWAVSSDTVEIVSISFVLPSMECDMNISTLDKGILNAAIFLGMMIGGLLWGNLGDKWGRKRILVICLLINGLAALASGIIAHNFWFFASLRLISGIGVGGSYPVAFSYLAEFQASSKRGFSLGLLCSLWMIAGSMTAALAWGLVPIPFADLNPFMRGWRIFIIVCTLPALSAAALVFFLIPESPKFLLLNGKKQQALTILRSIASMNGSKEPIDDVYMCQPAHHYPMSRGTCGELCAKFKFMFSRKYRKPVIITIIIFSTLSFGFYGLLLWLPELYTRIEKNHGTSICIPTIVNTSSNHSEDVCSNEILSNTRPYWEALLVNVANLPGNLISVLLMDKIGRKILLSTSIILTAASTVIIPFLHSRNDILIATCVFGAVSAAAFNVQSVVNTEVVPTAVRSSTVGLAGAFGRVAALTGNLLFGALIDMHCAIPIVISASLLLIGGISSLFLPNTTNIDVQ